MLQIMLGHPLMELAELEERKEMFLKMIEGLEADDAPVKASA
ncbi:hypothetical protein L195_g063777, partial [Trifolium pratense]